MASRQGTSERRACSPAGQHRSTQRRPCTRDPRLEIRQRMHEIARTRIRYGYRRIHIMLRRDGWTVGRNLVWRLYHEEGLALRSKWPRRRKMVVHREARCMPKQPNEAWSLDFIHDQLSDGTKFRSSPGSWSTCGPTTTGYGSTSPGRGGRPTTRLSRRSTARCGTIDACVDLEPALVCHAGRGHRRGLAAGLQREPASHGSRPQDAAGVSVAQQSPCGDGPLRRREV